MKGKVSFLSRRDADLRGQKAEVSRLASGGESNQFETATHLNKGIV